MAAIKPLVAVVGQTATGKTSLAIDLAKKFNGEIICADSRTVYKQMNICTAKPTAAQRSTVKHHLLNVVSVSENFNASKFKHLASQAIKDIQNRGKLPLLVGGSGLFVDSVLYNYSFSRLYSDRSQSNPRHLDSSVAVTKQSLPVGALIVGIKLEREELRQRIVARAETMIKEGLVEEVRQLSDKFGWDLPAFQEPAFKAFRPYLSGQKTIDEAKKVFVSLHWQYAKRQMTWFKRNSDINWVSTSDQAEDLVCELLNK